MKKVLILSICIIVTLGMFSCNNTTSTTTNMEIAMIADNNTIESKAYNKNAWTGIETYGKNNGYTYEKYSITADSTDAKLEQVDAAVKNGAKIIAAPGSTFNTAIYTAQKKYPEIYFVLIDGVPTSNEGEIDIDDNTVSFAFSQQEAGYLAGYALVKEGYEKVGFLGSEKNFQAVRYGYGFVKGCNDAAKELKKTVEVTFNYSKEGQSVTDMETQTAVWYENGTQVIFATGDLAFEGAFKAASNGTGKVVSSDVNKTDQGSSVIGAAVKSPNSAITIALDEYYNGEFSGGEMKRLTTANDGVGFYMGKGKFTNFTEEDYKVIYGKVKAGKITVPSEKSATTITKLVKTMKLNNVEIVLGK